MDSEGPADVRAKPSRLAQAAGWLANPLLVTVVAAALSGLLIPYISEGWHAREDHQKALEIKTGLVTQMTESSSRTIATARSLAAHLEPAKATQTVWNKAYGDWAIESSSIGARVQAYVSPEIGDGWRSFGYSLTDFLSLALTSTSASNRPAQIDELESLLPRYLRFSRDERAALASPPTMPTFQHAYMDVALRLASWRDALVRQVLTSHMASF
jgi:hypothetical protein